MTFRKSPFTGFPFDDDREDGNEAFRSQLDDIAARHPEFAHHLGSFPFRSGARARTQIPEEFAQRFSERPFPDRFERFGFPFDEPAAEEENKPYYQRYPQYYPQEKQDQASFSGEEPQSGDGEVNEEVAEQEDTGRGRKLKNIQQSNTVDLGQRQEPVDDRNQRSMSAPPPNNRRFVSSINIPVNQPAEGPNMPQPSAPPQPQERVIPIHVEGRDEPIIPKRTAPSTSQPHVNPPQQSQPHTDKFFTQKSPNFSQYFNRDPNFHNWFPKNQQNKQPQAQAQAGFNQSQRGRSPQPQPKQEPAPPQPTHVPEQTEPQQKHVSSKPDPIDQIKCIQKDVSELMAEVEKFDGQPKDKKYLYLDEMLTRNLIKLDNIDTQGQENIRSARKEAIKCIEKCISILESKANSNVEVKVEEGDKEPKQMEIEAVEEKSDKQEISEEKTGDSEHSPENKDADKTTEQMEVDTEKTVKSDGSSEQQTTTESNKVENTSEEKMETSETNQENQQVNTETSKNKDELKQEKVNSTQDANKEIENRTEVKDDKDKRVADKKA